MVIQQTPPRYRILFLIDYILGIAGTENQLIKLINNLDYNKFEIFLVCLSQSNLITQNRSLLNCHIKIIGYNVFKHKQPGNLLSVFHLVQYIRSISPHLVMAFFKTSVILGVIAARMAGVKKIVSSRRDYGLVLIRGRDYFPIRFANLFVTRILTNSFLVRDLIIKTEKFDRTKIDVIYNGIDEKDFCPNKVDSKILKQTLGIRENDKVVGIVAGLKPMKRHHTLLRAAKRILDIRTDFHFVIVGGGPLRKELQQLCYEMQIEEFVHFVGNQVDVPAYLSIFDIGVNCSANEGLSNAIIEYMAFGLPCIVSRAGGNEELINHGWNGLTFKLGDEIELADHLLTLTDNQEMRNQFVRNSKAKISKKFSLEMMIKNFDRYFSKILSTSP